MIGRTIAHYEILDKIGEGGMGVVYKALDTHLDRSVAIKVLPPEKVADPGRKARFIQEAKSASALNHPNIVHIYDIDQQDGIDFMAMEFVAGKTLDELIPRKGMRLSETLKVAIQVADALSAAHGAGIIHRDLKPANIIVGDGGRARVLDFGLAKLTEAGEESEDAETRTVVAPEAAPHTEEGAIVGTASYMSPEQAEGRKLDARSDIFSFGSVLYEMVTGQRPFRGDSSMSTLGAIIHKEPEPLTGEVPHDLERIINRCLRKNVSRRFHDMRDLRVELEELKEESDSGSLAGVPPVASSAARWKAIVAASVAVVAVALTGWYWMSRNRGQETVEPMTTSVLTSNPGLEAAPSFSPDGNQVAFSWAGESGDNPDIYVKMIGSPSLLRLTTNLARDVSPAWSPDGRSIAFVRLGREKQTVYIVPAIGGPERRVGVLDTDGNPLAMGVIGLLSWFPDSRWLATKGLYLLSVETGETRALTSPEEGVQDSSPAVSPDGRSIAFSRGSFGGEIHVLSLNSDLEPAAGPRRLTTMGRTSFSTAWTPDGRDLIVVSGTAAERSPWRVPLSGNGEPKPVLAGDNSVISVALSSHGDRLAYGTLNQVTDIHRFKLDEAGVILGPADGLLSSTRADEAAKYSPDGRRILFASERSGPHAIWVSDADGANAVELYSSDRAYSGSPAWSPDGKWISFDSRVHSGPYNVYILASEGGQPRRLTEKIEGTTLPRWSADGKWLYFSTRSSGNLEIWKAAVDGGDPVQVTRNGGFVVQESRDGASIYYTKLEGEPANPLWTMPANGGDETRLPFTAHYRNFQVMDDGIYFISGLVPNERLAIRFYSFATSAIRTLVELPGISNYNGLAVSPDRRSILYSPGAGWVGNLMLVENFR
jgi:eukaryotic-like serine/threonine-protein kinase